MDLRTLNETSTFLECVGAQGAASNGTMNVSLGLTNITTCGNESVVLKPQHVKQKGEEPGHLYLCLFRNLKEGTKYGKKRYTKPVFWFVNWIRPDISAFLFLAFDYYLCPCLTFLLPC